MPRKVLPLFSTPSDCGISIAFCFNSLGISVLEKYPQLFSAMIPKPFRA